MAASAAFAFAVTFALIAAAVVVDIVAVDVPVDEKLPWDDLLSVLLSCGDLLRCVLASDAVVGLAAPPGRQSVGIAAAGVDAAVAVKTGVEDGLVWGDTASLMVSVLPLLPPQGRHDTNFPSVEGARDELRCRSLSLPLPLTGLDTTLPPPCRDFGIGKAWAMLSLRMTLPRFPSALPLVSVGWAVTALTFVPAAVRPSGLRES
jgi:hypothetical protein